MQQKYYGTVDGQGMGVVYANWYGHKPKAVAVLRRKAKELARQSFDDSFSAYYTLYLQGAVVASGEIPVWGLRHIRKDYPGNGRYGPGLMTIGGVRIA